MPDRAIILVAEDSAPNRDVLGRQLASLGYAVDLREDGKQALDAYLGNRYALLLTDCHMPTMDGYQLTAAIRKAEAGAHRMPIIAVTATSDATDPIEIERCLAAGMDDCIGKPIELRRLRELLSKWLPGATPLATETPGETQSSSPADGHMILDPGALTAIIGDNRAAAREIVLNFPGPAEATVMEIQSAFKEGTPAKVAAAAHKLKSSARAVGANRLADLCQDLEKAAKNNDQAAVSLGIPQLYPALDAVLERIRNTFGGDG